MKVSIEVKKSIEKKSGRMRFILRESLRNVAVD